MNSVIEKIYKSGMVEDAEGKQFAHGQTLVTRHTGSLLYHLIREYQPERCLEVGMAYGLSALHICQALSENGKGTHVAIDPLQDSRFKSIGLLNIERAGFRDIFSFHQQRSDDALAALVAQGASFDLAFIDGSHLFDYVIVDFLYVDRMLAKNGLIVFDDLWMPAVRKAVSFVLRNRAYELIQPGWLPTIGFKERFLRGARRIVQAPFARDWKLKMIPHNLAVLQKQGADRRDWTHHRSF